MRLDERTAFINDLCDGIKNRILSKAAKMPDEWDGYELRLYIADTAASASYVKMLPSRKREYRNAVIVNNL
jgi:hypothetical protein